jgi:hypothetical protein
MNPAGRGERDLNIVIVNSSHRLSRRDPVLTPVYHALMRALMRNEFGAVIHLCRLRNSPRLSRIASLVHTAAKTDQAAQ